MPITPSWKHSTSACRTSCRNPSMAMAIGMMREVTSAMHGISKMINLGCFLTLEFLLMTHIDLSIQVEGTERGAASIWKPMQAIQIGKLTLMDIQFNWFQFCYLIFVRSLAWGAVDDSDTTAGPLRPWQHWRRQPRSATPLGGVMQDPGAWCWFNVHMFWRISKQSQQHSYLHSLSEMGALF